MLAGGRIERLDSPAALLVAGFVVGEEPPHDSRRVTAQFREILAAEGCGGADD